MREGPGLEIVGSDDRKGFTTEEEAPDPGSMDLSFTDPRDAIVSKLEIPFPLIPSKFSTILRVAEKIARAWFISERAGVLQIGRAGYSG